MSNDQFGHPSWGAVERIEKGKRVLRLAPDSVDNDELTVWLIEAATRNAGRPLVIASLQSPPVHFPFKLMRPLAYLVSNDDHLAVRSEGPNNQFMPCVIGFDDEAHHKCLHSCSE